MAEQEIFGSFIKENKTLAKEYVTTRMDIYKLQLIRILSKSAGYFAWIVVSFFLLWFGAIWVPLVCKASEKSTTTGFCTFNV